MISLGSFLALVNVAIASKKLSVFVPKSILVEEVALFLFKNGYFAGVSSLGNSLIISFRYVNFMSPFHKLILVSKPSKVIYINAKQKTGNGLLLVVNSEKSLCFRGPLDKVGGKVLLRIL